MKTLNTKPIAFLGATLFVSALCGHKAVAASTPSMLGQQVTVDTMVCGYLVPNDTTKTYCSRPGTKVTVVDDDGSNLTVSIDKMGKTPLPAGFNELSVGITYTIPKTIFTQSKYVSRGLVAGILAVPFKFHISNRATTAGSTVGGYVGYRFSAGDWFAVTPILAGGLALISTQPAQVSSSPSTTTGSTETSSGFSVAAGLIGSVGASGSASQFGVLLGFDWLGRSTHYQYEGKPWLAFEVGYNFAQ